MGVSIWVFFFDSFRLNGKKEINFLLFRKDVGYIDYGKEDGVFFVV